MKSATARFAMRALLTVIISGLRLASITMKLPLTPIKQITLLETMWTHFKKGFSVISGAISVELVVLFVVLKMFENIDNMLQDL